MVLTDDYWEEKKNNKLRQKDKTSDSRQKQKAQKANDRRAREEEEDLLQEFAMPWWVDALMVLRTGFQLYRHANESYDQWKEGSGKKAAPRPKLKLKEKFSSWCTMEVLYWAVGVSALLAWVYVGHQHTSMGRHRLVDHKDYYEVLEIERGSDTLEVRKAYKNLAMRFHPDKNPDCQTCQERFAEIGVAYETLSSPEKRKKYDTIGAQAGSGDQLHSRGSVDVRTAANGGSDSDSLETTVFGRHLGEEKVALIQILDWDDPYVGEFHPFWEEALGQMGNMPVKFVRLDSKHSSVVKALPFRPVVLPAPFIFFPAPPSGVEVPELDLFASSKCTADGCMVELRGQDFSSTKKLVNKLLDVLPDTLPRSKDLAQWMTEHPAGTAPLEKLLVIAKAPTDIKVQLSLRLATTELARTFDCRMVSPEDVEELPTELKSMLPKEAPKPKSKKGRVEQEAWTLVLMSVDGSKVLGTEAVEVASKGRQAKDDVQHRLMAAAGRLFTRSAAPFLHRRNMQTLCKSSASSRRLCMALLNPTEEVVTKVRERLEASRVAHEEDAVNYKASKEDEDSDSDPLDGEAPEAEAETSSLEVRIVKVVTTTQTTMKTSFEDAVSVAGNNAFARVLAQAQQAAGSSEVVALLFDVEKQQYAGLTMEQMDDLHQALELDDLRLKSVSEDVGDLRLLLADPIEALFDRVLNTLFDLPTPLALLFFLVVISAVELTAKSPKHGGAFSMVVAMPILFPIASYLLREF